MKKYLMILFLAGCTQKQPEQPMSATLYYVTPTMLNAAISNAKAQLLDSIKKYSSIQDTVYYDPLYFKVIKTRPTYYIITKP